MMYTNTHAITSQYPFAKLYQKGVSLWALQVNSLPALVLREDVQMGLR